MVDNITLGDTIIEWLGHDTFLINFRGKKIVIDPFRISKPFKADYILITHSHYDHCSLEDISKLVGPNTKIICPADCMSKINKIANVNINIIEPNSQLNTEDFSVETIPAYNVNKEFHKRINNWLGYVIDLNGIRIYHAGDTDLIPEMKNLKNITIALLPVGGTYTMNAEEAAEAVRIINPEMAIPMHYGTIVGTIQDAQKFKNLVGDKAIILNKKSN